MRWLLDNLFVFLLLVSCQRLGLSCGDPGAQTWPLVTCDGNIHRVCDQNTEIKYAEMFYARTGAEAKNCVRVQPLDLH